MLKLKLNTDSTTPSNAEKNAEKNAKNKLFVAAQGTGRKAKAAKSIYLSGIGKTITSFAVATIFSVIVLAPNVSVATPITSGNATYTGITALEAVTNLSYAKRPDGAGFNIIESYSNGSSTEFLVEYYNRKTNSYLSQMSAGCMPFGGEWTCAKID